MHALPLCFPTGHSPVQSRMCAWLQAHCWVSIGGPHISHRQGERRVVCVDQGNMYFCFGSGLKHEACILSRCVHILDHSLPTFMHTELCCGPRVSIAPQRSCSLLSRSHPSSCSSITPILLTNLQTEQRRENHQCLLQSSGWGA